MSGASHIKYLMLTDLVTPGAKRIGGVRGQGLRVQPTF